MILQTIKGEPASRETLQAFNGCAELGIECRWSKVPGDSHECHVGSVEFCEAALGFSPRPDYYPDWLSGWLRRRVWLNDEITTAGEDTFAKPAYGYKSEPAITFRKKSRIPANWWCSHVVEFAQEWRYYVAGGKVLATGWYDGTDADEPAPELPIEWPAGFCGAVDFGRLADGRIALVECQHPYGCGMYCENSQAKEYVQWLIDGWEWTLNQKG